METTTGAQAERAQQQPKPRRPHRPRKDYTNLDTVFDSLDDLKTALRQYMENATTVDALPQYISCAMTLSPHAALPLKSPLEGPYAQGGANFVPFDSLANDDPTHKPAHDDQPFKSVLDLVNIADLKQRQIWQRAAAKGVVHQIQHLDGFKYCFNNNWSSKDDNGFRYSYTCLDSLENKDRHANGFRATNAATRRPGANTRGVRKPTYDCKGQIAVKFSGLRQSVEIVYKHHPIHKTVAERRPPPRRDAKRKSLQDSSADPDDNPDTSLLSFADSDPHDSSFPFQDVDSSAYHSYTESAEVSAPKKARRKTKDGVQSRAKRQKPQPAQPAVEQPERPLSLVEILQQSMTTSDAPPAVHEPLTQPSPPPTLWQAPVLAPPVAPSSEPTAPYQPLVARPGYMPPYQQPPPRNVGRFSKLSVPCFKCKAAHTQCDGRQPVCNSCQMRGTVCNYPSILRFDKTPVPDTRWIQVQPTQQGRGVFRVNQTPSSTSQSANPFASVSAQQMHGTDPWFPQQ